MRRFVQCWPLVSGGVLIMACSWFKANGATAIEGGAGLVSCVAGQIEQGNDTFEGIALACSAQVIEVVGVVETLAATQTDASAPSTNGLAASRVHHARQGK